jgi:hypothetical protein
MSEEIDKHLAAAMGEGTPTPGAPTEAAFDAPEPKSTSKRALKGPMVADTVKTAPPPEVSREELKLQLKLEILQELLAEKHAADGKVRVDKKVQREAAPPEETVKFRVNLPPQAANIRVDGREYYHGFTYDIPLQQALSMQDIQAQAWRHDEQVQGTRPHAAGARTGGIHINGQGQVMTNPSQAF